MVKNMTIKRRVAQADEKTEIQFITGAPDGVLNSSLEKATPAPTVYTPKPRRTKLNKGETGAYKDIGEKKIQITLNLDPQILDMIDVISKRMGIARSAYLQMTVYRAVQLEEQ
jgi:hypothetical protein